MIATIDFSISAFVTDLELRGDSLDEIKSKLGSMTLKDLLASESASIKDFEVDMDDLNIGITHKDYLVTITDIIYGEADVRALKRMPAIFGLEPNAIKRFQQDEDEEVYIESLPNTMTVRVTDVPWDVTDITDYVVEAVYDLTKCDLTDFNFTAEEI